MCVNPCTCTNAGACKLWACMSCLVDKYVMCGRHACHVWVKIVCCPRLRCDGMLTVSPSRCAMHLSHAASPAVRVCVHVCACMHAPARMCVHALICIPVCVSVCICAYVCAYMRLRVCACVYAHMQAGGHACMHACGRTGGHAGTQARGHVCLCECLYNKLLPRS